MEVFIALLIIYVIFLVVVGIPSALVCIIAVNHQRACQKLRTETLDLANGHKAIFRQMSFLQSVISIGEH